MQNFQDLQVWKKAHQVVLTVYSLSKEFPPMENYGLVTQLRRTSISVTARVAEGSGRSSNLEFAADLKRSRAAANELEYLLILAHDLGYLSAEARDQVIKEVVDIRKMLSGLINKLASGL